MLRDIRNRVDFFLRSSLRWGRTVDVEYTEKRDAPYQAEFEEFFPLFDWKTAIEPLRERQRLVVADIGCRTFLFAPVHQKKFRELGFATTLHGIEIDAYRRFTDFRTRNDYGKFYASRAQDGYFHPIDVLDFAEPLDVAFLLDPFVVKGPLLHWGLPSANFVPERIVEHVHRLLAPQSGLLVTSNPDEEERDVTYALCERFGFRRLEERYWEPKPESESSARFGAFWATRR